MDLRTSTVVMTVMPVARGTFPGVLSCAVDKDEKVSTSGHLTLGASGGASELVSHGRGPKHGRRSMRTVTGGVAGGSAVVAGYAMVHITGTMNASTATGPVMGGTLNSSRRRVVGGAVPVALVVSSHRPGAALVKG